MKIRMKNKQNKKLRLTKLRKDIWSCLKIAEWVDLFILWHVLFI